MVTLEDTLRKTHDWVIDRIHTLSEYDIENARSIQSEFSEWLDPNIENHDVISLEFISDI
jgi:hypothetical protein